MSNILTDFTYTHSNTNLLFSNLDFYHSTYNWDLNNGPLNNGSIQLAGFYLSVIQLALFFRCPVPLRWGINANNNSIFASSSFLVIKKDPSEGS